jgi:hypothetical protein
MRESKVRERILEFVWMGAIGLIVASLLLWFAGPFFVLPWSAVMLPIYLWTGYALREERGPYRLRVGWFLVVWVALIAVICVPFWVWPDGNEFTQSSMYQVVFWFGGPVFAALLSIDVLRLLRLRAARRRLTPIHAAV